MMTSEENSPMTRRELIATLSTGLAACATPDAPVAIANAADITVGITSNTRPEWAGAEGFVPSLHDCSELGYHWIETFSGYLTPWKDDPQALVDMLAGLDLKMETVSNGGGPNGQNMSFQDPTQHEEVIETHMALVRYIKAMGCDHLKINCGNRNAGGNTDEIYQAQAKVFNELGKRISDEGLKFGIHAHMWSQFETPQDVQRMMEMTDPDHVYFVCDTGHVTIAGMDSLALTKQLGHRIIEFHLKDVAPKDKGGYRGPALIQSEVNNGPDDLIFYSMGKGGVEFPKIHEHLNSIGWKGWFTVELDRAATTAKEDAAKSKHYIENTLGITV